MKTIELNSIPCIHLKTGKQYYKLANVIDCTNGQNDKIMVLYRDEKGVGFVREEKEFYDKFKLGKKQ